LQNDNLVTHFVASMIAGFNAAVITSPVDVIKSRVMSQKIGINGENLTYSGTADYFVKIVKTEGLFGTLGFFPNWMRIGPHTIVTFLVYEQLRKMAGISTI